MSLEEDRERTARALKAVREGAVRVADTGGKAGNASEAGEAAGMELARAEQQGAPSDMPEIEAEKERKARLEWKALVEQARARESSM